MLELVEHWWDPKAVRYSYGYTPLHYTCWNEYGRGGIPRPPDIALGTLLCTIHVGTSTVGVGSQDRQI